MEDNKHITEIQNWRRKAFIIGAIGGAVVGLAGAYLLVQKAEDPEHLPDIKPGDVIRLGLLVLGLLRSVAELGN